MRLLQGQNQRESWWATNNTAKVITISDLPQVPEFDPGQRHDLLRYCSKEKVNNSEILVSLMTREWITLVKKVDGLPTKTILPSHAGKALDYISRDDIDGLGTGGGSGNSGLATARMVTEDDDIEEDDGLILADATDGEINLLLPEAPEDSQMVFYVKKIDNTLNAVKVNARSGNLIDNTSSTTIPARNACITIVSFGNDWWII